MNYVGTHIDLFSGIGGFTIAAQLSGWRTIGFSEIDPYASAVLKKHWPHIQNFGDISNVTEHSDLLTAGPPCQPASIAGHRNGPADDRWLWPKTIECVARVRPTFCLFENPTGLLTLNGGVEFERVLSSLERLGYSVQSFIIPSVSVDAKHRRDRVWIVAHSNQINVQRSYHNPQKIRQIKSTRPPRQSSPIPPRPFQWPPEPNLGRMAHGIPSKSHRLECLGNSIVPQVAQILLSHIAHVHQLLSHDKE